MKITLIEQRDEQTKLRNGWVRGLTVARSGEEPWWKLIGSFVRGVFHGQHLEWRFIVRVDGRADKDGEARIRVRQNDVTRLGFRSVEGVVKNSWQGAGNLPATVDKAEEGVTSLEDGDNKWAVVVPAGALTTLTIETWQAKDEGNRQEDTIHILTRRYECWAYGLLAPFACLLLFLSTAYLDLKSTTGDPGLMSVFLSALGAGLGIPLTAILGNKLVDVVTSRVERVISTAKSDQPPRFLLRWAFLWVPALIVVVYVLPRLFFVSICNVTQGEPRLAGYPGPMPNDCRLVTTSPFSELVLDEKSSEDFVLLEEAPGNHGVLAALENTPRQRKVDCKRLQWDRFKLTPNGQCAPNNAQQFDRILSPSSGVDDEDPVPAQLRAEPGRHMTMKARKIAAFFTPKRVLSAIPLTVEELFANKDTVKLPEKPFNGSATFLFHGDKLICYAPAKTEIVLIKLGGNDRRLFREVSVECRGERKEYELASQFYVATPAEAGHHAQTASEPPATQPASVASGTAFGSSAPAAPEHSPSTESPVGLPICLPKDAIDCRLSMNAHDAAVLTLPKALIESRKISTDDNPSQPGTSSATCPLAGNITEARMAKVTVEGIDRVTIKAGGCETRWSGKNIHEVYAIFRDKGSAGMDREPDRWDVSLDQGGSSFRFPKEVLSNRKLLMHNAGDHAITCRKDATKLMLLNAENVGVNGKISLNRSELGVNGKISLDRSELGELTGASKVIWLCMDDASLPSSDENKRDGGFEAQCRKESKLLVAGNTRVWISESKKTMERCDHPPSKCCYVCAQYYPAVIGSPVKIVGVCGQRPNPYDKLQGTKTTDDQECLHYKRTAVECND